MTNQTYLDTLVYHKLELEELKKKNPKITDFDSNIIIVMDSWTIRNDTVLYLENERSSKFESYDIIHLDEKYMAIEFLGGDYGSTFQALLFKDRFITDDQWYEQFN